MASKWSPPGGRYVIDMGLPELISILLQWRGETGVRLLFEFNCRLLRACRHLLRCFLKHRMLRRADFMF